MYIHYKGVPRIIHNKYLYILVLGPIGPIGPGTHLGPWAQLGLGPICPHCPNWGWDLHTYF